MNTDVQKIETALTEFSAVDAGIAALKATYGGIVYAVTTIEGLDAAKKARAVVREPRFRVEQIRKDAKAPILALGKKLDEEARRITAALLEVEAPIDVQIKAEEDRKEREKQARIDAERKRVADIQDRIAKLRGVVQIHATEANPAVIADAIIAIDQTAIDDSFAEFADAAKVAKLEALAALDKLLTAADARVAEKLRIAEERAELERMRAEQEKREAVERERQTEANRQALATAEREAEKNRRERAELDAERERIDRQRQIDEERATAARAQIEREREDLRKAREPAPPPEVAPPPPRPASGLRPTDAEIIAAVQRVFGITYQTARTWIIEVGEAASLAA